MSNAINLLMPALGLAVMFYTVEVSLAYFLKPMLKAYYKRKGEQVKKEQIDGTALLASSRIVGSLHNIIQIPIALVILFDKDFSTNRVYQKSDLSYFMTIVSSGYFLYDIFICFKRFSLEGPFYTTHAIMCFLSYFYGGCAGLIHYHGAAFLLWETSTPFVHLRWLLYKLKLDNTKFYTFNGILMVISFFLARIVWGYYSSFVLVSDVIAEQFSATSRFPLSATIIYCVAAVVMNTLNTIWFYKMVKKAADVLIGGKKATEVGDDKDE